MLTAKLQFVGTATQMLPKNDLRPSSSVEVTAPA
jgi:hypothetical protein